MITHPKRNAAIDVIHLHEGKNMTNFTSFFQKAFQRHEGCFLGAIIVGFPCHMVSIAITVMG